MPGALDLSINLGVIMQGLMLAALLHHTKSVRELLTTAKIHDFRINRLESGDKCRVKTNPA